MIVSRAVPRIDSRGLFPAVVSYTPKYIQYWPRFLYAYVSIHGLWLALYALLGKGFAYAGWAPLYVSEILLGLALMAIFNCQRIRALVLTPIGIVGAFFFAWQLFCAVPYLQAYGMNTLRDSVIWGYSIFAWATAGLVLRLRGFLNVIIERYATFAKLYLVLGPATWLATLYLQPYLPTWPDTAVSIPWIKGGEYCVHLAGIFAFSVSELASNGVWTVLILADVLLGMGVRGGLLAFLVSAGLVLLLRPKLERFIPVAATGVVIVVAMAAFDLRFTIPNTTREFSLDQLSDSLTSVIGVSERRDLEGTKNWRLGWWRQIWSYTIDGQFFWQGKGYGINLADSDGYQVGTRDEPLRSPHNSHLTFLARSGVPGFGLWVLLQGLWASRMLRDYVLARRLNARQWAGVFSWILGYWLALIVSASFDVVLEGPMAGIPFWTLVGLGWGGDILFTSQLRQGRT